jgi:hypothetical protein
VKNDGESKYWVVLVFFILSFIIFNIAYIYQHELTHQVIFSYFGINSTIKFTLVGGVTIPDQNANITCDAYKEMMLLHGLNDVFDYHIGVVFYYFFVSMFFIIAILIIIIRDIEKVKEKCQAENK